MSNLRQNFRLSLQVFTILIVLSLVFGLVYLYDKSNQHLYNISNYAIAISLGFASVCFSWSRAEDITELRVTLLKAGQTFVVSTTALMIATLFDYGSFSIHSSTLKNLNDVQGALNFGYFLVFGLGAFIFVYGLWLVLETGRNKNKYEKK